MPRTHLTDVSVRSLKPQSGRQIKFFDRSIPGFGVRVNERGSKSWIVMFGRQRRLKVLGRYPDMALAVARKEAKKFLATRGSETDHAPSIIFEEALALFLTTRPHNKPRTIRDYTRLLSKHFLPQFRTHFLDDISTQQVLAIIDRLISTPSECAHAFVAIKIFFRWAERRNLVRRSPCERLQRPTRPVARQRVLDSDELVQVWRAADSCGFPFGTIVKLLMLTGQRRSEIASLRWEYINEEQRTITLPASLTKNNRQHTFPFGEMTYHILDDAPHREHYLSPARGNSERAFSGWSKSKARFDQICTIAPWTLHDLRRTFATNLAALNVPLHVVEKLLNHVTGTISGVAAIYNRFQYMEEMREAVSKWEMRLASLFEL